MRHGVFWKYFLKMGLVRFIRTISNGGMNSISFNHFLLDRNVEHANLRAGVAVVPFFFPLRFVIIVGRHRAVGLHVGNDMLAGIGKEIATRPPNSLDIAFLFAGGGR